MEGEVARLGTLSVLWGNLVVMDTKELDVMRAGISWLVILLLLFGCGKAAPEKEEQRVLRPATVKREVPRAAAKEPAMPLPHLQRKQSSKDNVGPLRRFGEAAAEDTAADEPPVITARKKKKVMEFVEIGGKSYLVPYPWRGRKIDEPQPSAAALVQIPPRFTWQNSTLFIHRDALGAFLRMAEAAESDGIELRVHSGFRSVRYQRQIFVKLMAAGRSWQDLVRYVAPPGYSNHMLGYSIDLYPSNWRFASTDAYQWLRRHGEEFGFYETYPERGGEGYPWEAWHWQYIPQKHERLTSSTGNTIPDEDGT